MAERASSPALAISLPADGTIELCAAEGDGSAHRLFLDLLGNITE